MCDIRVLLVALVVAASVLSAQAPANPSFETASVKPSDSGSLNSGFRAAGEQFTATNVYLSDLIRGCLSTSMMNDFRSFLESTKAAVEFFVVDSVAPPTPD